jgi:hypothetical protein
MSEQHFTLSDDQFIQQFENGSLDSSWFTHVAHLRVAYIYINLYGANRASKRLANYIKQFDKLHGKGDKYHKTITYASVAVVYHFKDKAQETTFLGLLQEFPRLKTNFKDLLLSHYNADILDSQRSRFTYVLPDKLADPVFDLLN